MIEDLPNERSLEVRREYLSRPREISSLQCAYAYSTERVEQVKTFWFHSIPFNFFFSPSRVVWQSYGSRMVVWSYGRSTMSIRHFRLLRYCITFNCDDIVIKMCRKFFSTFFLILEIMHMYWYYFSSVIG